MSDLYSTEQEEPAPVPAAAAVQPDAERVGLSLLCDPMLDPLFWPSARPTVASTWYGHVPFAHWIVAAVRPDMIVELGTHTGVSYTAFCEAVLRSGLDARCVAVDTWNAGGPGEAAGREFTAFHDSRYAGFSTMLTATFDDASEQFEDGSVDLLHIHGLHTYDAVRHDFETWLPKIGQGGVVLLHDTGVAGGDFGVQRFWEELRTRYPAFEFTHSNGLGVVAVGAAPPAAVAALCQLTGEDAGRARERFARVGELHELRSALAIAVTLIGQPQTPPPLQVAPQKTPSAGLAEAPEPPPAPPQPPRASRRTTPVDIAAGITVVALPDAAAPVAGMEDIWTYVERLLRHLEQYNESEPTVHNQQVGMIRDGCFLLPSACADDAVDICTQSYYLPHRFYYLFDRSEEYFWVSGALDEAYALSTLYFPERHVAVTVRPGGISEAELLEFERLRAAVTKPDPDPVPSNGRRVVVTGFPHFVHTLWNELPALERAAAAGLGARMQIAAAYSPFGPLLELLPELDCEVAPFAHEQTQALNSEHGLIVGLGSLAITQSILERVREVALHYTDPAVLEDRNRFGAECNPVFWLSVKPPPQTCLDQAEVLRRLIVLLRQRYPAAGFILNGTSRPWDIDTNPNYAGWFSDELAETSTLTAAVIDEIMDDIDPELRDAVRVVSEVSVCEEITWGAIADFYFCHLGTMQNKIGWTHHVPGMVHTSSQYRDSFDAVARVVENGPPCYLIPARLVEDLEIDVEPALEGERDEGGREGGDYRFTSVDDVAHEVIATFERATPAAEQRPLRADPIDE